MPTGIGRTFAGVVAQSRGSRMLLVTIVASALIFSMLPAGTGLAQVQLPNQVTGLAVEQGHGFATLSWDPVEEATDYQIERTAVDDDDNPTEPPQIWGLWRPDRSVTPESPRFADSGFNLGDRFQWRVRARFDGVPMPYSEPVFGTTLPPWGDPDVPGENLRTEFERTQAAVWTSDVDEFAYTAALDEASERVRVMEIGRTVLDRPINMFIIGHPAPLATTEEISESPSVLFNCISHGNEPATREACLIAARELAFADDPRIIDILSNTTVLLVPSMNGDGRAANTRGNVTGQDLNRDHALIRQPETFAIAEVLRDYTPEVVVDGHQGGEHDQPLMGPRHANTALSVFAEAKEGLIESWMFDNAATSGWWVGPYRSSTPDLEGKLGVVTGLKNIIGELQENRPSGGPTRPSEGSTNTPASRMRKSYGALWHLHEVLDYHRANQSAIVQAIEEGIAFNTANEGRIVFRGSHPWPPHPHVGETPPMENAPTEDMILEDPPCGYLLTEQQYTGPRIDGPVTFPTTVAERIAAHDWTVEPMPEGYLVPLSQPQRGLIPLLLDGQAPDPWVDAERLPDGACQIKDTVLELSVEGRGQNMTLTARLTELDAPQDPVAGRTIDFYSDGELIGSEQTDSEGITTIPVPPGHRGTSRTYEAVFEGDDFYRASSDRRTGRSSGG